ncbi:MAG: endonuclease III [Aquificaceae bacterium]|uniref:endonuclease III domain-containing protein n=1 Tax=Hydrogenobacter sp. Uz 6-8 TaxID=3384828 RepID=UPI0030A93C11
MRKEDLPTVLQIMKREYPRWHAPIVKLIAQKRKDPLSALLCALLSTRTRDETTAEVCKRFLERIKSPQDLLKMDLDELQRLIHPVGFYRNKAKHLKELARQLVEEFGGKVPDTMEDLLRLRGVGRKVANIVLSEGFGKPAIAVDVHVHRISNRWGLVRTRNPEETEKALMQVVPQEYWRDYNRLLVAFGQTICRPVRPKCGECPVSAWCDYYRNNYGL